MYALSTEQRNSEREANESSKLPRHIFAGWRRAEDRTTTLDGLAQMNSTAGGIRPFVRYSARGADSTDRPKGIAHCKSAACVYVTLLSLLSRACIYLIIQESTTITTRVYNFPEKKMSVV